MDGPGGLCTAGSIAALSRGEAECTPPAAPALGPPIAAWRREGHTGRFEGTAGMRPLHRRIALLPWRMPQQLGQWCHLLPIFDALDRAVAIHRGTSMAVQRGNISGAYG